MKGEEEIRKDVLTDVSVRWHDGYLENFRAREVRFGSDLLWLKLAAADGGGNRHIPLRQVRWFSLYPGSHEFRRHP